jgi:pilus assembly protein CpaE
VSYRVVIAAPTTELAADLAETVAAAGAQTVGTVTSETGLREQLTVTDPDVVLIREELVAGQVWSLVRETVIANPYLAVVVASTSGSADVLALAMDAGARAVVALPLQVEDVAGKIMSAGGWAQTMRRVIGGEREAATGPMGQLVVVAGSKGGVGTTTIATHLALTSALDDPTRRVCLVDLDVAKGDVPLYLDIEHRRSILDLAPVAEDLSPRSIADALFQHPSGLAVLLAPAQGELSEQLTSAQVCAILAGLRLRHDVVLVDAGAVVNEVSAAAVEMADEVYVVTTPDVPSLRGARRLVETWERLVLRKEDAVRCIINRADKRTDVQPETAAKIAGIDVVTTRLPAAFRALEAAGNQRDPELVTSAWRQRLAELAVDIRLTSARPLSSRPLSSRQQGSRQQGSRQQGLRPGSGQGVRQRGSHSAANTQSAPDDAGGGPQTPAAAAVPAQSRRGRRASRANRQPLSGAAESGQASLELVGLFPLLLLLIVFAWQAILTGISAHMASNSAEEGARAAAVGGDVEDAARAAVPAWLADDLDVQRQGTTSVRVTIRPPLLLPGARPMGMSVSASAGSVSETDR